MIRDIELHTAYYVEYLMGKDRYKGVNPAELSDHYFSITMEIDHAHAIELNRGTFSGDDVRSFSKSIIGYHTGKPVVRVV